MKSGLYFSAISKFLDANLGERCALLDPRALAALRGPGVTIRWSP